MTLLRVMITGLQCLNLGAIRSLNSAVITHVHCSQALTLSPIQRDFPRLKLLGLPCSRMSTCWWIDSSTFHVTVRWSGPWRRGITPHGDYSHTYMYITLAYCHRNRIIRDTHTCTCIVHELALHSHMYEQLYHCDGCVGFASLIPRPSHLSAIVKKLTRRENLTLLQQYLQWESINISH